MSVVSSLVSVSALHRQLSQSIKQRLPQKKSVGVLCLSSNGQSHGTEILIPISLNVQLTVIRGILIQYFIQYGASFVDGGAKNPNQGTAAFRIPWGIQMVPAFILLAGMFFLPRSPRWLASKDRWEEA